MTRKNETQTTALAGGKRLAQELRDLVSHPGDLDEATERLGIPPLLVNPHFASRTDLSELGYGPAVHLPVQISSRTGGRKSLYYLHPGEKALVGIIVAPRVLAFSFIARETGCSVPARAGDLYTEEIRTSGGETISNLRGRLEVLDARKGEGRLVFDGGRPREVTAQAPKKVTVKEKSSYFFSLYSEETTIEVEL